MSKQHEQLSRKEEQNEQNPKQNITFGMERLYPQMNFAKWDDPFGMKKNIGANIYAKMEVSQPGDPAEMQADNVADAVMNGNVEDSQLQMEQNSGEIMAKGEGLMIDTPPGFEEKMQSMKGGGVPLSDDKRENLEEHMNADLGDVRLHTGPDAAALSESIDARAFASGQDIFFADDHNDEELLAHEVVHTVQDQEGLQAKLFRSSKDFPWNGTVTQANVGFHKEAKIATDVKADYIRPDFQQGDKILVLSETKGWYHVERIIDGKKQRGYIDPSYVSKITSETVKEKDQVKSIKKPGIIHTEDGANLRSEPNDKSEILETLGFNSHVFVHSQESGGWNFIETPEGLSGYVQSYRIRTNMPDPDAFLYKIQDKEAPEKIAKQYLRLYEVSGLSAWRLLLYDIIEYNNGFGNPDKGIYTESKSKDIYPINIDKHAKSRANYLIWLPGLSTYRIKQEGSLYFEDTKAEAITSLRTPEQKANAIVKYVNDNKNKSALEAV